MPKRHKQQQTSTSRAPDSTSNAVRGESNNVPDERSEGEGPQTPRVGLRQFVEDIKGKQHRVIEMRIILICSLGVFSKVLFSEALAKKEEEYGVVTYGILAFAARK